MSRWASLRRVPAYGAGVPDFVVLGEDPLAVGGDKLTQVPVLQTWVGGQPAWSAPGYASLTAPPVQVRPPVGEIRAG